MSTPDPPFTPESVKRHYTELAGTYATKENRACKDAYRRNLLKRLGHATRLLEIGAGVSTATAHFPAPFRVACDLSQSMLRAAPREDVRYCAADGTRLPFADASFDAVMSVNVLEHTPQAALLIAEAGRVLVPGGDCVFITPNGDCEWLLNMLEGLRLKLPEGPHRFLSSNELRSLLSPNLQVIEHRKFLALPLGPAAFVNAVDTIFSMGSGRGLFQLLHAKRV
ncbi:MAG: methyltransferase domain-containing protein [Candidatus Hydrogenedentales bacterium]